MLRRRLQKNFVDTHSEQQELDSIFTSMSALLDMFTHLQELKKQTNDPTINKAYQDTKIEITEKMKKLYARNLSITDLVQRFGGQLVKSEILKSQEYLAEQESKNGETVLTDMVSEDQLINDRNTVDLVKQTGVSLGFFTKNITEQQIMSNPRLKGVANRIATILARQQQTQAVNLQGDVQALQPLEYESGEEDLEPQIKNMEQFTEQSKITADLEQQLQKGMSLESKHGTEEAKQDKDKIASLSDVIEAKEEQISGFVDALRDLEDANQVVKMNINRMKEALENKRKNLPKIKDDAKQKKQLEDIKGLQIAINAEEIKYIRAMEPIELQKQKINDARFVLQQNQNEKSDLERQYPLFDETNKDEFDTFMEETNEKYGKLLPPKEAFVNAQSKRFQKIKLAIDEGMKGYDEGVKNKVKNMMKNFNIPLKDVKKDLIPAFKAELDRIASKPTIKRSASASRIEEESKGENLIKKNDDEDSEDEEISTRIETLMTSVKGKKVAGDSIDKIYKDLYELNKTLTNRKVKLMDPEEAKTEDDRQQNYKQISKVAKQIIRRDSATEDQKARAKDIKKRLDDLLPKKPKKLE